MLQSLVIVRKRLVYSAEPSSSLALGSHSGVNYHGEVLCCTLQDGVGRYAHLGLEDAQNEMIRLEELNRAKEEVAKAAGEKKPVTQRSFRAV